MFLSFYVVQPVSLVYPTNFKQKTSDILKPRTFFVIKHLRDSIPRKTLDLIIVCKKYNLNLQDFRLVSFLILFLCNTQHAKQFYLKWKVYLIPHRA